MRTIKTLGIATAMALALISIAGAGMASANYFKASVEPETWNGSLSGQSHHLILGSGDLFYCKSVSFSGETVVKSNTELSVRPELGKCEHQTGAPDAWGIGSGCKFRFKAGVGPALVGSADIVGCATPMVYENLSVCRTEIGNQSGLGTVEYKNTTVGGLPAVTVIAKLTGITYTRKNTGACAEGIPGTFSDGTYQGEWTVTGTKSGVPVGAEVESTTPPLTKFATEEAPATILGKSTNWNSLSFGTNGKMSCSNTYYNSTQSTLTSASITAAPEIHECYITRAGARTEIPDADISAGACRYEWKVTGALAVVGTGCAAKPLSVTTPGCTLTVGPQSGLPGLSLSNEGSGKLRKVKGLEHAESPSLTYTATGGGCTGGAGTFSNGSYRGSVTFSAKNSKAEAQGFWIE